MIGIIEEAQIIYSAALIEVKIIEIMTIGRENNTVEE
jgi:hypothetical protein